MAGELSQFGGDGLLDHLLKVADFPFAAEARYFGISRADPGETGATNDEPIGEGNYARAQILGSEWNAASGRAITNIGDSNTWTNGGFPQLTAEITNATHWTFWRTPTGQTASDYLGRVAFPAPQTFPIGSTPIIEDGSFSIGWTAANNLTTFAAHKLLEHFVVKTQWDTAAETRYAYLTENDPTVTGNLATEPTGGSYARADAAAARWGSTTNGSNDNANGIIQFPKATADWRAGAALGFGGVADQLSGGNALLTQPLDTAVNITTNRRPEWAIGAYLLTID